MIIPLRVMASDPGVRKVLLTRIAEWPGLAAAEGGEANTVIIATPRECSPEACRQLTKSGNCVVILTPIWREYERANYHAAGASDYVPMDLDLPRLTQAVTAAAAQLRLQLSAEVTAQDPVSLDR